MTLRRLTDDLGADVHVAQDPRRLVSLVPSISELLWWWHLADRVVGVTDWCVAPPRAFDHARRVRGTKNPDVAAIAELAPDLVVADMEENRAIDVERLRAAGVTVWVTRVRSVADAADAAARLGEVVGRADAGIGLRQTLLRAVQQVRPARRPIDAVCPIWRDGASTGERETWWVVGPDTFAGDLLRHAGFRLALDGPEHTGRVGDDVAARYPRAPLDAWLAAGPDVVLLPDEPFAFGPQDAEEVASHGVRVRHLDGTALSWWGPRTPHAMGDLSRLARQLARRRQ